jgi:hypothetical protein
MGNSAPAIEVFPSTLVALETRAFVQLVRLARFEVFGYEFHFPNLVARTALGRSEDCQETPVHLMERRFKLDFQVRFPAVWVSGGHQVIDQPEKISAVARAHELLSGLGFRPAKVERLTASAVSFAALAGA